MRTVEQWQLAHMFSRQYEMDYCICHAMAQYRGILAFLICYDIACQWFKNFASRVQRGAPHLQVPSNAVITPAVGKFHLSAHITECFVYFSLLFIVGAAQNDGEVMERLWSSLNKAAPNTRTMSTGFRRETLDWQMNFMNWIKCLGAGE
jgi:hypothetical protein